MKLEKISKVLKEVKGTTFVSLKTKTPFNKNRLKKGHPFGNLHKIAFTNFVLNPSYEKSVNRALKNNGENSDFKAGKLPYGSFVKGFNRMVIEHKGTFYLRVQKAHIKNSRVCFVDSTSGKVHFIDEVEPWLKENNSNKRVVEVRNFKFDNIIKIKIKGQTIEA